MHYYRVYRHGDPLGVAEPRAVVLCSVDECERRVYGRGWCSLHWQRWRRTGDPLKVAFVRAPNGSGNVGPDGYRRVCRAGRKRAEHVWLMEEYLGRELLPKETVHHRNGARMDNRLENLELWSSWQPAGQRVEDKVAWAKELLALYEPDWKP